MATAQISGWKLDTINDDCLLGIVEMLSPEDRVRLAAVCRGLRAFITGENRFFIPALPPEAHRLPQGLAYHCFVWLKNGELYECFHSRIVASHDAPVRCLAVLGTRIVSGSEDKTIRVWENGRQVHCLQEHEELVMCLLTSGNQIISGSYDGTVRVWENGEEVSCLRGHRGAVRFLAACPNRITSGGDDETIRSWENGLEVSCLPREVTAMTTFGGSIIYGSSDHSIYRLEGVNEEPYSTHESPPQRLAVLGDRIICALDRSIVVLENGVVLHSLALSGPITCLGILGNTILYGLCDNTIRLSDSRGREISWQAHDAWVTSLVTDSDQCYSASFDGTVRVWALDVAKFEAFYQARKVAEIN